MKQYINEHPWLTLFIVLSVLGTIRFLFTLKPASEIAKANGAALAKEREAAAGKFYINQDGSVDYSRKPNGGLLPF